jgi:hypothetical protein
MQSPRAFAGALALLLGVPLALVAASQFDGSAPIVIHAALAMSFFLLAASTFDFNLPTWFSAMASVAIGALAIIFTLQGASDFLAWETLRRLAFDQLGQSAEKILGYAFLLWCLALLCWASAGTTRLLGAAALAIVASVEIYSLTVTPAPEVLKLLYLPVFAWLLLEGVRRPLPA